MIKQDLTRRNRRFSFKCPRWSKLLPLIDNGGLGALSYVSRGNKEETSSAKIIELEQLVRVAQEFEQGIESNQQELALLFGAGSSLGGARPKVLLQNKGIHWLAKFPSVNDKVDIVNLENAALSLAAKSGLDVPQHKVVTAGHFNVLLVKRFDISDQGGAIT